MPKVVSTCFPNHEWAICCNTPKDSTRICKAQASRDHRPSFAKLVGGFIKLPKGWPKTSCFETSRETPPCSSWLGNHRNQINHRHCSPSPFAVPQFLGPLIYRALQWPAATEERTGFETWALLWYGRQVLPALLLSNWEIKMTLLTNWAGKTIDQLASGNDPSDQSWVLTFVTVSRKWPGRTGAP